MVIQRIQSFLLLIAAVLMCILPFIPFGYAVSGDLALPLVGSEGYASVLIVGLITGVLFLVDIFLYKTFQLQKKVLKVALFMAVVTGGLIVYFNMAANSHDIELKWGISIGFAVAAIILGCLALKYIRRDEKLLRSYDRIR